MRAEIKVVETKKRYKRSIKLKVAVLGNINKTEKPLAALKKKKIQTKLETKEEAL